MQDNLLLWRFLTHLSLFQTYMCSYVLHKKRMQFIYEFNKIEYKFEIEKDQHILCSDQKLKILHKHDFFWSNMMFNTMKTFRGQN
jgi:hypothetical protein